MREIYEIELSTSAISIITNKVNQAAQEWQNRPLDPVSVSYTHLFPARLLPVIITPLLNPVVPEV